MFRRLWLRMVVFSMLVLLWCLITQRKREQKEQPQLTIAIDAGEKKIQPSIATTHPEVSAIQEKNQETDDLTQISGIGPKISAILQDAGITNYAQLADIDEDEIKKILSEAGLRLGDPVSWIQQAQALTHGD